MIKKILVTGDKGYIGTLLTDAKDTGYGSLLPKVKSI